MVFSSFTFMAFFLPAAIVLHFLSKRPRWRNGVLLAFSLVFYAWGEPRFILLMLLSVAVNYVCALLCDRAKGDAARTAWTLLGVGISLAFLVWFKYYAFLVNSVCALLGLPPAAEPKTLPIGISFYTFQIITYTVDVWRRRAPVQKDPARLALYISFFPQLIAGPIVSYTDVAPFLERRDVCPRDVYEGLSRFFLGLGKKVLLANVCGEMLSRLTLTGEGVSVLGAWLGAVAFTFQIYFDFSGYSDMAIGMGCVFGFRFRENFDYPYVSRSVTEFWRRWHISLGTFFRDHVYIPLGGNRVSRLKWVRNILVVWMLTGAWHGASWNFVVWGLYYALLLMLERLLRPVLSRLPAALGRAYTLLLVIFGWVLFYHESLADGLGQLSAMLGFGAASGTDMTAVYCLKHDLWVLLCAAAASLPWRRLLPDRDRLPGVLEAVRAVAVSAVFVLSLVFLAGMSYDPFLYFRF